VPEKLQKFTTTLKDRKYGIIKLPTKLYRRNSQEFAGTEELVEEFKSSQPSKEEEDDVIPDEEFIF
jgi:hypothetical protein